MCKAKVNQKGKSEADGKAAIKFGIKSSCHAPKLDQGKNPTGEVRGFIEVHWAIIHALKP